MSFRWVTNNPTHVSCPAREYYFHFALTFSNCCCCHCFHSAQGFEPYNSWWAHCSNGWQFVIVIGGGGDGVIRYNNQNDKSFFSFLLSSLPSPFIYPLLFSSFLLPSLIYLIFLFLHNYAEYTFPSCIFSLCLK